jgi:hypothetical protein
MSDPNAITETKSTEPGFVQQAIDTSQQGLESIKNTATDLAEQTKSAVENVRENVSETMGDFSSTNAVDASQEFLESNSIIAKIGFILLVLIVFFFALRVCMMFMSFFLSPSSSPYLVNGMVPGNTQAIISQNPKTTDSVNILRSNNEDTGVEFSWSVWLLVQPSTAAATMPFQNVFTKGDGFFGDKDTNKKGLSMVDNGPGLFLLNDISGNGDIKVPNVTNAKLGTMKLVAVMDVHSPTPTQYSLDNMYTIDSPFVCANNIPIGKWFHVVLRLENTLLDLYINGVLSARTILQEVPKQNYGDVTVCGNGGFSGQLSNLRYYNHALNVLQISSISWWGPNTNASSIGNALQANNGYTYLSSAWYNKNI